MLLEKDGVRFSTIRGRGQARWACRAKIFEGAGMSRSYAAGSRSKNGAMHMRKNRDIRSIQNICYKSNVKPL